MKRAEIKIEGCHGCPFGHGDYGQTICVALAIGEGSPPRVIPNRHIGSAHARPPRWCPLREQDHLVTLRVK